MSQSQATNLESESSHQPPSHVHGLIQKIAGAPSRIAPERIEDLKKLVLKHDLEIFFKDEGQTSFEMGAMYGKVFLPLRVCQHLWGAALLFAALYIERESAISRGEDKVDLLNPDVEVVLANYELSCVCFKEEKAYPFPPEAKHITTREDFIELADEIFLTMISFSILHEVAHLERGDSKTNDDGEPLSDEDSFSMEFAADKWSYDWILAGVNSSQDASRVFVKRSLGVIFSLAQMNEFQHHRQDLFVRSHPQPCDRLLQFFEDYADEVDSNPFRATFQNATYIGLQVTALVNRYLLPHEGFSSPIEFIKLAKENIPAEAT